MCERRLFNGQGAGEKKTLLFFVPQPRPRELGRRLRYNKQGKHPFNLLTIEAKKFISLSVDINEKKF